jgi:hypothetical protein
MVCCVSVMAPTGRQSAHRICMPGTVPPVMGGGAVRGARGQELPARFEGAGARTLPRASRSAAALARRSLWAPRLRSEREGGREERVVRPSLTPSLFAPRGTARNCSRMPTENRAPAVDRIAWLRHRRPRHRRVVRNKQKKSSAARRRQERGNGFDAHARAKIDTTTIFANNSQSKRKK